MNIPTDPDTINVNNLNKITDLGWISNRLCNRAGSKEGRQGGPRHQNPHFTLPKLHKQNEKQFYCCMSIL